jgi:hypothetical protein
MDGAQTGARGATPDHGGLTTAQRVKAILVGSMGNLIEWFDVYAFAAFQLYFAPSFRRPIFQNSGA